MKNKVVDLMLIALFLASGIVFGQDVKECMVLIPEISGNYKGKLHQME